MGYTEGCCHDREYPVAALDRGVSSPIVDYLVKDRLTGAIILVLLIVLLVPELLSGPKGPGRALSPSNSAEEQQLRSYTITLGDDARARGDTASGPAMPQAPQPESAAAAAVPASQHAAGTAVMPEPANSSQTAPPADNGAPSSAPTAKASEHSAGTPSAERAVNPNRSSGAAHSAGQAVSRSSSASTRSSPAGTVNSGWLVQLGVFASRENAERLAVEMRTKGMRAAVSDVSSSGRRLYRVRVGPVADRASAQELQSRLKASGHSAGTLIPPS